MNSKKLLLRLAGTIFGIVAVFHLLRVVTGASVIISGWDLPIWVNMLGFVGTAILFGWMWCGLLPRSRVLNLPDYSLNSPQLLIMMRVLLKIIFIFGLSIRNKIYHLVFLKNWGIIILEPNQNKREKRGC